MRGRARAPRNARRARRSIPPEAIFADPEIDVALVYTPPFTRRELVEKAVAAGKEVITTKPLAPTVEDARAIAQATANGRCLVIYKRTGNPQVQTLKRVLDSGEVGSLALYHHDWIHHFPYWAPWAIDPKKNGGPLVDAMIHNLNTACFLAGREVTAYGYHGYRLAQQFGIPDTELLRRGLRGRGHRAPLDHLGRRPRDLRREGERSRAHRRQLRGDRRALAAALRDARRTAHGERDQGRPDPPLPGGGRAARPSTIAGRTTSRRAGPWRRARKRPCATSSFVSMPRPTPPRGRRQGYRRARLAVYSPARMPATVLPLDNPVQNYAWGSITAIADFLDRPSPTGLPEAELWIGAHPSAPSRVADDAAKTGLDVAIRRDPVAMLGETVAARYGQLPFLLKLLAAREPLSIQCHPNAEQARAGFARENAAGIPIGDPTRNYRDPNHKPELLVALTPTLALKGFRPLAGDPGALRGGSLRWASGAGRGPRPGARWWRAEVTLRRDPLARPRRAIASARPGPGPGADQRRLALGRSAAREIPGRRGGLGSPPPEPRRAATRKRPSSWAPASCTRISRAPASRSWPTRTTCCGVASRRSTSTWRSCSPPPPSKPVRLGPLQPETISPRRAPLSHPRPGVRARPHRRLTREPLRLARGAWSRDPPGGSGRGHPRRRGPRLVVGSGPVGVRSRRGPRVSARRRGPGVPRRRAEPRPQSRETVSPPSTTSTAPVE